MIYTLTLNPAIDYNVKLGTLSPGGMNRTDSESVRCGGKGINVSAVLKNLGTQSTALGFIAGFTGDELERQLAARGIKTDFIRLESGITRICMKIAEKDGRETEINASGPDISASALDRLKEKLCRLGDGDTLLLAGSVPGSVPDDIYEDICSRLSRKVRLTADASGKLLTNILRVSPWLIKHNQIEAGEICGTVIDSHEDAERCALHLRGMGAVNVIVSMGANGSVLAAEDGRVYHIAAAAGTAVNTVGSGD
ncbi:MAG: 1-phosphofructokinase family hexose kinase [Oscillospiraceae bacterium]|nr:1-phosphofructokinase family hexose kinase [Oscillospiraceae bacterium]